MTPASYAASLRDAKKKFSVALSLAIVVILAILLVKGILARILQRPTTEIQAAGSYAGGDQEKPCLRFFAESAALSYTTETEPVAHHSYTVSNGNRLQSSYYYYRSVKKAKKNLAGKLNLADKILTHEPKRDKTKKIIGNRLVVQFKNRFEVRWTEGSTMVLLSGTSLDDLLQFEKRDCD